MKRIGALLAVLFLSSLSSAGQTLPELFQKAKAQIKGESWQEAMQTLDRLETESARPGNETTRQPRTSCRPRAPAAA
jgi:hypothetical protein